MNRPVSAPAAARQALRWVFLAMLVLAAVAAPPAWANDIQAAEYRIKAAFLCKFGNYVEWPSPAAADTPFNIGVLATSAVVDELTAVARGQMVNGRPIVVRKLERGDPMDGVDMLFIARTHTARLAETLAALKDRPVLTVTETEPGVAIGSMVNFVIVDDKVKFDISLATVDRSKLRISARLLGVARTVAGGPPS
ncbi:YfiR family protein [Ideonella sp.]|uniref:YfiR family protein n=1 Tax=Ideonella sp. TaxID=1929293 RepID=UPI0035B0627E